MTKEAIFKRIAIDDGYVSDKAMFAVEADRMLVYKAMDEYAKQQAVSFVKWGIESGEIIGDHWGDAFIPGEEETLYDKFIEQQNKNK